MEETEKAHRYVIDLDTADGDNRSLAATIAWRKCYACRQGDTDESVLASDPREHLAQIAKQCSDTPDYLLQDTPIKEAIFRVILAGGNEPATAEKVSGDLMSRWAMSAYPRELSPAVIGKLLDHSQGYSIVKVPDPDPEEAE